MNAKGRVKGDGAFKFYVSKSLLEEVWAITHDARRTTHYPRRTTHDPLPTHPRQLVNLVSQAWYQTPYKSITNKNELWKAVKFSKTKISMPFNRLKVCPSLAPFVFTVFIIPSLNVLSDT